MDLTESRAERRDEVGVAANAREWWVLDAGIVGVRYEVCLPFMSIRDQVVSKRKDTFLELELEQRSTIGRGRPSFNNNV